jgi:hypothetical protein
LRCIDGGKARSRSVHGYTPDTFFPEVAPPMQALLQLLITALVCVSALWILRWHRARTAAAAESKAEREAMWLRRVAQQKRVRERLLAINEESLSILESMPGCVESAEHHLDQAEIDFVEGAFAPFWNSVERALVSLAGFDGSVQRLGSNSGEYIDLVARCKGPVPSFAVSAVSPARMRLATATSHRLHGIVRRAQRDFQFSVIYEHRKTNQILVAGFRSLAQAVEEMASRISESIDSLTTSVDKMTSTLDESIRRLTEEAEKLATGAAGKVEHAFTGKSGREQRVLEVLDRIERNRYRSAIPGAERWGRSVGEIENVGA